MSQYDTTHEITRMLHAFHAGDTGSFDELMVKVYHHLRRIARGQLRGGGGTISSTELVHEAWFKLAESEEVDWQSRGHFFAIAARAMRQILVDRARERMALKRGAGEVPQTFDEMGVGIPDTSRQIEALLSLNQALDRLSSIDERLVHVVECRFFAGLTTEETAEALQVTQRTIGRDWVKARTLLRDIMGGEAEFLGATRPSLA